MKIVKNVVELPPSWGIPAVHAHVYVVHSNNVQRYAEVPTVRINYDILPIIVHVSFHSASPQCLLARCLFGVGAADADAVLLATG